jgi:hypothetical protein
MTKNKTRQCKVCGKKRDAREFGSDYPDTCGRCMARQVMGRD